MIHAVEDDLAGAARLDFYHPVKGRLAAVPGAVRVARVAGHLVTLHVLPAVDADHHALAAETSREPVDQVRVFQRGGVDRDLLRAGAEDRLRIRDAADTAGDAERD